MAGKLDMIIEIVYGIIGGSGFAIAILVIGGVGFRRIKVMRARFRNTPDSPDQGGGYDRGTGSGRGIDGIS
jgi:hypothetical protein